MAALQHVGASRSAVATIDGVTGEVARVTEIAAALAPFAPRAGVYYPGLRRVIEPADVAASDYVAALLRAAAPMISGGFHIDRFELLEASFSLVTAAPETLDPVQRVPHFDSSDPNHLAVMHYVAETAGTAFFRQRSTGIELVAADNRERFIGVAREEGAGDGYIAGSDARFEQIGMVTGVADRLAVYRGQLLHSGIIAGDASLSGDPRAGRLTANLFLRGV